MWTAARLDPARQAGDDRAALETLADREPTRLQALDPILLLLRDRETCGEGLPAVVGEVRRAALMDADAISTTWRGWNVRTGAPEAVRCPKPAVLRDPVWGRRLERGAALAARIPGLAPLAWRPHGEWPHVHASLPGVPLDDLLPAEDPPDAVQLVRWSLLALDHLGALHERGLVHGSLGARHLLVAPSDLVLAWFDPVTEAPGTPAGDLAGLARALAALDPESAHPLVQAVAPWIEAPPASVPDALGLVRAALSETLLAERHRLAARARRGARDGRTARLHRAATYLARALPPPVGRCCLSAASDGSLVVVESDGRVVRGGAAAGVPPRGLPVVHAPDRGLDAPLARRLLRAWARRDEGDPALRARAQAAWGGDDATGEALARWLSARSRLRRAVLLLDHRLATGP